MIEIIEKLSKLLRRGCQWEHLGITKGWGLVTLGVGGSPYPHEVMKVTWHILLHKGNAYEAENILLHKGNAYQAEIFCFIKEMLMKQEYSAS